MTAAVIGSVGSPHDVLVDARGSIGVDGRPWSLDWWVGAADRWHEPGPNAAQQRVDGLPVVETSLRVPGGQVVHRAWGVAGPGGRQLVVVDVENRSKEPVAVALVVRGGRQLSYDGDRAVVVEGAPALTFGRRPARTTTGDDDALRVALGAGAGDAPASFTAERTGAAFVFPLAHTATLRMVVPLDGGALPADVDLGGLPDPDAVLRGWRGHVDAGVRVGLPDERLLAAVVAARSTLLIQADRARNPGEIADVVAALDGWGHHDAAAVAADPLLDLQRMNGSFIERRGVDVTAAVLAALGGHARATGDAGWAEAFVGPVARAAHRMAKAKGPASAQLDAADVLELAGQPDAAELCRSRAVGASAPASAPASSATGVEPASTLLRVRSTLVDDSTPGRIDVLPTFPDEWLGQEVEAHRLPTRAGLLSFAIRWHGARPALLWERDRTDDGNDVELRCPGLDPTWSSTEPTGEALLAPVEPVGGLPKVVAPLSGAGTPVGEVDDDHPGSFR